MMDKKDPLKYRIFGKEGEGIEAIKLLAVSPYGKQVIAAQVRDELRRRLGIIITPETDCTACVRPLFSGENIDEKAKGKDIYLVWTDMIRGTGTKEELETVGKAFEKELNDMGYAVYFDIHFIPNL